MASILLMSIVGLVLIYAEFFVPGGFLVILGAAVLIISAATALSSFSSFWFIFLYWILLAAATVLTIKLALKRVQGSEGSVVSSASQEGYVAHDVDTVLIGQTAQTLTDLRPAGFVIIAGERKTAISHLGYIAKGTTVVVIEAEGPDLIVREI